MRHGQSTTIHKLSCPLTLIFTHIVKMVRIKRLVFVAAILFLSIPTQSQLHINSSKSVTGFSLKLIHKDPFENLPFLEKLQAHFYISAQSRWSNSYLKTSSSIAATSGTAAAPAAFNATAANAVLIRPHVTTDGGFFMVQVSIGTPAVSN